MALQENKDVDLKILMVCLGNICRSPLAHGILEQAAAEKGLKWEVDSAGTGGWHVGQQPDRRSIAVAKKYGVDISTQRARRFSAKDFERYDYILVMDRQNLSDVCELAEDEQQRKKVRLLLKDDIIPDPYWDDSLFEPVYQTIKKGIDAFVKEIYP